MKKIILVTWILYLATCSSYQKPEDFERARQRAADGQSNVAAEVLTALPSLPPEMRFEAIDTLAAVPGREGSRALMQAMNHPVLSEKHYREMILGHLLNRNEAEVASFIRTVVREDPLLYGSEVGNYLIAQNDKESAEFLLSMVRLDSNFLTERMVRFFGEKKHTAAIPDLQRSINNERFIEASIIALTAMENPGADRYIVALTTNPEHPGRAQAVYALSRLENHGMARSALLRLLTRRSQEPEDIIRITTEAIGELPYDEESFEILTSIYHNSAEPLKSTALYSLANMKGIAPDEMQAVLQAEAASQRQAEAASQRQAEAASQRQAEAASQRQAEATSQRQAEATSQRQAEATSQRQAEATSQRQAEAASQRQAEAASQPAQRDRRAGGQEPADYTGAVSYRLQRALGSEDGRSVQLRIHNAMLAYSRGSGSNADFFNRAYRNHFNVSEVEANELLGRGLQQRESLTAVMNSILAEYTNDSMRTYALANFFAIARWQAEVLLFLHRERSL